jgi:RNA polymerase sigma-54 factor
MNQGHSINQVLSHKQATILAPQLQQGVRLLQLSAAELQKEIDLALESNPFLEKMDFDSGIESLTNESFIQKQKNTEGQTEVLHNSQVIRGHLANPVTLKQANSNPTLGGRPDAYSDSKFSAAMEASRELTLNDFLRQQASATPLSDKQHFILEMLVDSVNDRGYLRATIDDIVQLAMPDYVVSKVEVSKMIGVLQDFEPVGVGARTSSECLDIQLREKPTNTPGLELAKQIVKRYLLLLAKKNYRQIATELGLSEAELHVSIELIRQLNPFPGTLIASKHVEIIAPDLIVKKIRGSWVVRLNPNVTPAITVHHESADLLKLAKGQDGYEKLKQTLQDARLLLSNIEKRYQTILRVATLIIDRQLDFLEQGESALKPLTQKEIADRLEIHVSTVSRAVNDKFIMTPTGVVELSSFFCSAINCSGGASISSKAIQVQIKTLIDEEAKAKPLSDNKISNILQQRGIHVARRTIMKYRGQLGIPSSAHRRIL